MNIPPINVRTPCVVKCSYISGVYSDVMSYEFAKRYAMQLAADGYYAEVLRVDVMVDCYGGRR